MINATYSTAAATAIEITVAELAEMLTADNNPRIFPGKNKRGVIATGAHYFSALNNGRGTVFFDRCTFGSGYTTDDAVTVGFSMNRPVFEFEANDGTLTYFICAAA
tara:strand:+ start:3301 stop:3618 length:318 start_codon:yes stop_codon:yes gene_type:complete